jgi:hypothetical protein
MSNPLLLLGADNPGPELVIACLNLLVALAAVSLGLLFVLSVSLAALLCDRTREPQPIRLKADRKGVR